MASNHSTNTISKAVDTLIEVLPKLVRAINETATEVGNITDNAVSKLKKLRDEGVQLETKLKAACQDVLEAVRAAKSYFKKDVDFFEYGKEAELGVGEMTKKTQKKDYQQLLEMLKQFKRSLVETEKSYLVFDKACLKASTSSLNAAEECRRKRNEAEMSKQTTKVVGGTVVSLMTMAFSALTLGATSTVSGMVSGLVGAAGATTCAATGTYFMIESYRKLEEQFHKLSKSFNELNRMVKLLEKSVENIIEKLETIASIINDEEKRLTRAQLHEDDNHGLWELLFTKLEEGYAEVAPAQQTVKEIEQKLQQFIDTL